MSILRKTVLTTAIIGAGLASTTGAAFAGDCPTHEQGSHEKSQSAAQGDGCLNAVEAANSNGADRVRGGDVDGGDQAVSPSNVCGNFSHNKFLTGNNIALLGDIHNGNTSEETTTVAKSEQTDIFSSILG